MLQVPLLPSTTFRHSLSILHIRSHLHSFVLALSPVCHFFPLSTQVGSQTQDQGKPSFCVKPPWRLQLMDVGCPSGTAVGLELHLHLSLIISCRMPPNLLSQPDCNDPRAGTLSFISGSPASGSGPGTKLDPGKLLDDTELFPVVFSAGLRTHVPGR